MHKRHFLASAGLAGLALSSARAQAATAGGSGPVLLTVSGALAKANRGAMDPVVDQMMGKHGLKFDKAWAFDSAAIQRLPAVTIKPTLEYDGKVHTLRGPLVETVLRAAGAPEAEGTKLGLRAVDGYNVELTLADVRRYRMIIATHLDGHPMALGGLGPQWAVYDADRLDAFKDKPLKERFEKCPWGLYHIDVKTA